MSAATYDGDGLRATATSGTGSQSFVWDDVSPIPQVIMDSGNAYIYTLGVAPAEQVNLVTGAVSYLVTDSLGSVRGVVSGSGTLTATTSYDAWGNPETTDGLTASTPFGYAGGYTDPTGLIYLINRYYDPQTGQFISVDPALAQTLQPYEYAADNPVSQLDPSGKAWVAISYWVYEIHYLGPVSAWWTILGGIWLREQTRFFTETVLAVRVQMNTTDGRLRYQYKLQETYYSQYRTQYWWWGWRTRWISGTYEFSYAVDWYVY